MKPSRTIKAVLFIGVLFLSEFDKQRHLAIDNQRRGLTK